MTLHSDPEGSVKLAKPSFHDNLLNNYTVEFFFKKIINMTHTYLSMFTDFVNLSELKFPTNRILPRPEKFL